MILEWHPEAWEQYTYWQTKNKKILRRVNELIKDIKRGPFCGLGSPEPLKHGLSGYWSRRIDNEHRLVYKCKGEAVIILSCRFHY